MNIILVTSRTPNAKAIAIGRGHLVGGCIALVATVLALATLLNYAALRLAAKAHPPLVPSGFSDAVPDEAERTQAYLRDNLDAMATRLGELQAQILRLDTLGERVARLAGFKPQEFMFEQAPGRAGALPLLRPEPLSLADLARSVNFLSHQVDERRDKLGMLDSLLTQDRARKELLPSVLPIAGGAYNSNFGWRLDPFNGRQSFHQGVDFIADTGSPIVATAAGIIIASEYHPQYGNMIEIDHGNGLVSLYAHCSKRLVRVGDVVMKGAKIAEVGRTGRATGPHLHFEVRHHGVSQNPARFLRLSG